MYIIQAAIFLVLLVDIHENRMTQKKLLELFKKYDAVHKAIQTDSRITDEESKYQTP